MFVETVELLNYWW